MTNVSIGRSISVHGYLPQSQRLVSVVRQALENKLPKLAQANADQRILLIESPTHTESESEIVKVICDVAFDFPLLSKIDDVAFAKTFWFHAHRTAIYFRVWNRPSETWAAFLKAVIR